MTRKADFNLFIRALFWAACLAVAIASLAPMEQLPPLVNDIWDKAQHAFAFFVLGILGLLAYRYNKLSVAVGLLCFGAIIELAQTATGWRYGDLADLFADAVGLGVSTMAFWLAKHYSKQISSEIK